MDGQTFKQKNVAWDEGCESPPPSRERLHKKARVLSNEAVAVQGCVCVCLSVCLSICLSVSVSVCLSVCMWV